MTKPVRWGGDGILVEPSDAKENIGSSPDRPEAAGYMDWLFGSAAAGINLDRKVGRLLSLPLISSLEIEDGVGAATFSRSTVATYVDLYGVIQTAAVDEPRFEAEGYLAEGAGTNEVLHSKDIADADWVKVRSSISGSTTGPDNVASSADKLIEDATASNTHYINQVWDSVPGDNSRVSGFFDVKQAERTWVRVVILDKGGTLKGAYFNLALGVVGTFDSGITGRIRVLANGFYRCFIELDDASTGGIVPELQAYLSTEDGVISYDGDGTSGIYITDGQAEDLPFSSSYIDTLAAAVTRTADILDVTSTGNIPRQSEPSAVLFDLDILGLGDDTQVAFNLVGESTRVFRAVHFSGNPRYLHGNGSAVESRQFDTNTKQRIGALYSASIDRVIHWRNGVLRVVGIPSDLTDSLGSAINIGHAGGGASALYGHLKNFRVYAREMTNPEMVTA